MTEGATERCDVLVVGAGPAGSTCARQLRSAGLDVLVMDRAHFPRDKVCAGWITPAVVDLVGLDVAEYGRERVIQPITAFRTGVEGRRSVETVYHAPVSYGIRRCEFDHYLLERAGARLALGEALRSLRRDGSRWVVNGRIETPLVIGAGGHFCPVARHLGARPGRGELTVTAQEIEFEMDAGQRAACRVREDMPELYFCADMKGYAWCFRKGDFLNVGIGREGTHHLARFTAAFRDRLVAEGRISPSTPPDFNGHAYLLYSSARREPVADGALLIGDAAGLAYPQSGEGIRPAIESALMAADVVIAARGRYARERLAPYAAALERRFGRRRPPAAPRPTRSPLDPVRRTVGTWLLERPWFARHVLIERWFLHSHQPRL